MTRHDADARADRFDDQRWLALQRLERMVDHWYWRPGWRIGRSFYTWHLTFEDAPHVQQLAALYQQKIELPFLDPVPAEGLHLTLQGIGFADEVSNSDLAAIIAETEKRCNQLTPFQLMVGPADADPQGAPLALRPWEPIENLRHSVRDAIGEVWGQDAVPDAAEGFHPHVTVFYSNAPADPTPLRDALAELRQTPRAETIVRKVSLIRLNRDQKVYRWDTVAHVPIGPSPG
jgi:2'-5' RNA ligase